MARRRRSTGSAGRKTSRSAVARRIDHQRSEQRKTTPIHSGRKEVQAFQIERHHDDPPPVLRSVDEQSLPGTGSVLSEGDIGADISGGAPGSEIRPQSIQDFDRVSGYERTTWYVELLFNYTNQLIERTQVRCNYVITATSIGALAFFTTMNSVLSDRDAGRHLIDTDTARLLVLIPTAIFFSSLVAAVRAVLPRIYEYEIELNQTFISRKTMQEYRRFVSEKSNDSKVNDFIDEIHVLSRILNDKNRLVRIAAGLFFAAVLSVPATVAAVLV